MGKFRLEFWSRQEMFFMNFSTIFFRRKFILSIILWTTACRLQDFNSRIGIVVTQEFLLLSSSIIFVFLSKCKFLITIWIKYLYSTSACRAEDSEAQIGILIKRRIFISFFFAKNKYFKLSYRQITFIAKHLEARILVLISLPNFYSFLRQNVYSILSMNSVHK